ncbi:MAG: DUF1080 domain-containing protein [Bacteroidota bacterium]
MRTITFLSLLVCSLCFSIACQNTAETTTVTKKEKPPKVAKTVELTNTITEKEIANGWQLLFDGRSLDQWKGYNLEGLPKEGWTAENGELVGDGGGDLITKEQFEDFELELEFKLSEATNSGIFYFAQEIPNSPIYHSAPEYQLVDNATYLDKQGADFMHKHLTGDAFDLYDGVINPGIVQNKWFNARIISEKGQVEHWLNGKLCIEYDWNSPEWNEKIANSKFNKETFAKVNSGHIGLQYHGNKVRFRNIKIRRI